MKITDVEAIYLRLPQVKEQCDSGQDALIVKVTTDAGITGIGEVDSAPLAVKGAIEGPFSHTTACGLRELLIGEDPFQTEYLWYKMYRKNIYGGRRGAGLHAMSGIDIALWDIKGKAIGQPIWKLLGGGFHKRIRPYASSLFGPTPRATGELARRFRDRGFSAVKFGWDPMGRDEETDIALVREARRGLGNGADLMIDAGLVGTPKPRSSAPGPLPNTIFSGWKSRCCPTTTKATASFPRQPTSALRQVKKRATGSRFSN